MNYLERYHTRNCDFTLSLDSVAFSDIMVVIPSYKEHIQTVTKTLITLDDSAAEFRKITVLLLINVNIDDSEEIKKNSEALFDELSNLAFAHIDFNVFYVQLEGKHAGVGLARKILMDAVLRLCIEKNKETLIVNLDADTLVEKNYLTSIQRHFSDNDRYDAASIQFAHDLNDAEGNTSAIVDYELHLRCFVNMQRLLCLPFAYQTIGSAMVVKSSSYAKEGGMVKRKAGEDFYFLHKFSRINGLSEINGTTVIPSSRTSDRVPFGTGKAVNDILNLQNEKYKTYNPKSFEILDEWLLNLLNGLMHAFTIENCHITPNNVVFNQYLISIDAPDKLIEMYSNVTNFDNFLKRFFNWFDAFQLMKYLHFMRDNGYPDVDLEWATSYLFKRLDLQLQKSKEDYLLRLRMYDQETNYYDQCKAGLISKLSRI